MSSELRLEQVHPERYAGFLFDCDGTLVDSLPAHFRALQTALQRYAVPLDFSAAWFRQLAGLSVEEILKILAREQAIEFDDIQVILSCIKESFTLEMESLEPVTEIVEFARAQSEIKPLAVVSGSTQKLVEDILRSLDILHLFRAVVTPGGKLRPKPAPDIYLEAARRLGVMAELCLVFEDSDLGFKGARSAGMDYVRVTLPDWTLF